MKQPLPYTMAMDMLVMTTVGMILPEYYGTSRMVESLGLLRKLVQSCLELAEEESDGIKEDTRTTMSFELTPDQVEAWVDSMLHEATDDMARKGIDPITPEQLHLFFEQQYHLPLPVYVADTWLRRQHWYAPDKNS